jgi:uncharacterized cupin superfamily protein
MHILAGQDGLPPGFATMELTVPPHFAGPIPHAHDEFDEAIYVLSGRLLVHGGGEPAEAVPGSLFVAPRGHGCRVHVAGTRRLLTRRLDLRQGRVIVVIGRGPGGSCLAGSA